MWNIKKLASVLVAGVISISGMQVVNGFADAPANRSIHESRDINEDDVLDLFDVIAMNKYLKSINVESNHRFLDVNDNSVVSSVDSKCIHSGSLGITTFQSKVEGSTETFQSYTSYESKSGMPYTVQTFAYHSYVTAPNNDYSVSTYNLSLYQNNNAKPSDPPVGIIGDDDRYANSIKGIVYLTKNNNTFAGTGFIVADNIIATAAHCVFDQDTGGFAHNLKVYPKTSNGFVDNTVSYNALEVHIPYDYYDFDYNDMYDYALIKIGTNLTGSDYPHFALGMPYNVYTDTTFEDFTIYASGFPQTAPNGQTNGDINNSSNPPRIYTGEGNVVTSLDNFTQNNVEYPLDTNIFNFDSDLTPGTSGGPVYVKEKYRNSSGEGYTTVYTVVSMCSGIYTAYNTTHETMCNMGPIMNAMMLKFYLNNEYL